MLTYDKAKYCYEIIRVSKHASLRVELFRKAIEYARIRAEWQILARGQRVDLDQRRTLAHDAFIDACNILSRNMLKDGEDNSWRADLGDGRKVIGDFACYVLCFLGIEAR